MQAHFRCAALAAVTLLVMLSSCATTDSDGCETDECRSSVAEAKARWAQEDAARDRDVAAMRACVAAEANPRSVDPRYLHQCHLARWQRSGIACSDLRIAEQLIEVTCEIPIRGTPPDFGLAIEMIQKRAAVAALAAGRTHLMPAGDEAPVIHYSSEPDRVMTCQHQVPFVMWTPVNCQSTSLPRSAVGATLRRRYELLTEADAAARTTRDLPPDRQPQSAREINQLYAGFP